MTNIIQKLNDLGYQTIDGAWYDRVADWDSWYKGDVADFHHYTVWNGQKRITCKRHGLKMAEKVCKDWANLLMNEKVKITLGGKNEQAFIDEVFKENDFYVNMNELQERGATRGTYAIIPRVEGVAINESGGIVSGEDAEIVMDFISAESIFPLSWRGRKITECAFATTINAKSGKYTYLQIHERGDEYPTVSNVGIFRAIVSRVLRRKAYVIRNLAYKADEQGNISTDVALAEVPGFENVPERIYTGSDRPQFVIGRYNIANNVEENNPMGIAVYANAIDNLKAVDIVFDAYVNEYQLGKKRIMTKPGATINKDGESIFDPNEVVFHVLPEDFQEETLIHEIDMTLRSADLSTGTQDMLKYLGFKCGFGTNYYKFENGVAVTATETIYNNQDLHESVNKNKIVLRSLLEELCRILLRMGNTYMGAGLNENTSITIDLDDSVFVNKEVQLQDMRIDVQAGLLKPEIYIAQKYGVTEAKARSMMPGMEDLTAGETQDEVE